MSSRLVTQDHIIDDEDTEDIERMKDVLGQQLTGDLPAKMDT